MTTLFKALVFFINWCYCVQKITDNEFINGKSPLGRRYTEQGSKSIEVAMLMTVAYNVFPLMTEGANVYSL